LPARDIVTPPYARNDPDIPDCLLAGVLRRLIASSLTCQLRHGHREAPRRWRERRAAAADDAGL